MKIFHEDSNENGEKILQFQGMFRTFSEVVSANSVASVENNTCETFKKSYSSNYHLKRYQKKHENNNVDNPQHGSKLLKGLNHINAYNSMTK